MGLQKVTGLDSLRKHRGSESREWVGDQLGHLEPKKLLCDLGLMPPSVKGVDKGFSSLLWSITVGQMLTVVRAINASSYLSCTAAP